MAQDYAQWLHETMRFGICCSVIEGHRSLGRHGKFEDACKKTSLKLTPRSLELGPGGSILDVQLKELRRVETHQKRPSSPVFRTVQDSICPRLATLRWNHTGRQERTKEYMHIMFPTVAETQIFCSAMGDVQRFGIKAVLEGRLESNNEPMKWQVAQAQERFRAEVKKWRGFRLGASNAGAVSDDGLLAAAAGVVDEDGNEEPEIMCLDEDGEMHERWALTLEGRSPADLPPAELAALIHSGMPLKYRYILWKQWLSGPDVGCMKETPPELPTDVAKQITLDLHRTHPAWVKDPERKTLETVLRAYAGRNPEIGYCQGMNFIAMVFILLGFDEQLAFAGLCYIVERICPDYHSLGLSGYLRDTAVLSTLVHLHLPQVHLQLETAGVFLNVIALDHFMTTSARSWPMAAVVKLWDLMFLEGSRAIFASFLALLELYAGPCMAQQSKGANGEVDLDAAEFMESFKHAARRGVAQESDVVMQRTRAWIDVIPQNLIEKLRSEIIL